MISSESNNGSPTGLINPMFPGGITALTAFVEKTKCKLAINESPAKGSSVFVEFVVNTDGSVSDSVVLKGLGMDADLEAVRIVSTMPDWTPGTLNGEPIRIKLVLPINFSLATNAV